MGRRKRKKEAGAKKCIGRCHGTQEYHMTDTEIDVFGRRILVRGYRYYVTLKSREEKL